MIMSKFRISLVSRGNTCKLCIYAKSRFTNCLLLNNIPTISFRNFTI